MSTHYAIVGIKKLKTLGNIKGVIDHMTRARETPNSNGKENDVLKEVLPFEEIKAEIASYMPRKNAVLCYELLLTSGKSYFDGKTEEEIREWELASLAWASDKFGKDSLLGCICHRDEACPHLSILVLPVHEGKLNARFYTGNKSLMRALWTEYAEAMRPFGLERGREYSPAKHKDIKSYYADINESNKKARARKVKAEEMPSPGLKDHANPKQYACDCVNALTKELQEENAHLLQRMESLKKELEQITHRTAKERQAYQTMKENPALYVELEQALAEEKQKSQDSYSKGYADGQATETERAEKYKALAMKNGMAYAELEGAITKFFKDCIGETSPLRKTNKAPAYFKDFPALCKNVSMDMGAISKKMKGFERNRTKGIENTL